jgi:hypothetical protein
MISDNPNIELDLSWIVEQERLESIQNLCLREKMTSIPAVFIYVNQNHFIDSIHREVLDVSGVSVITKQQLSHISQSKSKKTASSIYSFNELVWFHVDLEPESIQSFSQQYTSSLDPTPFYNVYSILENIVLTPSIFIFHRINTLFFFFHEIPNPEFTKLPSILTNIKSKPKTTKKNVAITITTPISQKHRKTRKQLTNNIL